MPSQINCRCGMQFEGADHLGGRQLSCPNCGDTLHIPASADKGSSGVHAEVAIQSVAASDEPSGVVDVHCSCGASFMASRRLSGTTGTCPACESLVIIPGPPSQKPSGEPKRVHSKSSQPPLPNTAAHQPAPTAPGLIDLGLSAAPSVAAPASAALPPSSAAEVRATPNAGAANTQASGYQARRAAGKKRSLLWPIAAGVVGLGLLLIAGLYFAGAFSGDSESTSDQVAQSKNGPDAKGDAGNSGPSSTATSGKPSGSTDTGKENTHPGNADHSQKANSAAGSSAAGNATDAKTNRTPYKNAFQQTASLEGPKGSSKTIGGAAAPTPPDGLTGNSAKSISAPDDGNANVGNAGKEQPAGPPTIGPGGARTNAVEQQPAQTAGDIKPNRLFVATDKWLAAGKPQGAYTVAPDRPLMVQYSWMTKLLPYLGHQTVYDRLNLKKPWTDGKNLPYAAIIIPQFQNPSDSRQVWEGYPFDGMGLSHFVGMAGIEDGRNVVAGELPRSDPRAGVFGFEEVAARSQITDGESQTILLIGSGKISSPWVQGGGATVRGAREPFFDKLTGFGTVRKSSGAQTTGAVASMVDGSVRFLSADVDPQVIRALATIHGGESVDLEQAGERLDEFPVGDGPARVLRSRPMRGRTR